MAKRLLALLTALMMVMLASLAAAEGDTQTFTSDLGYSLTVPADWIFFDQAAIRAYVEQNSAEVAASTVLGEQLVSMYKVSRIELYASPDRSQAVQVNVDDAVGFTMELLTLFKSTFKALVSDMGAGEVIAEETVTIGGQDFYHLTIASPQGTESAVYLTVANDRMYNISLTGMDEKTAESILSSFSPT